MLNKKLLTIFTILSVILLPSLVLAITCNPCQVDGCICQITECDKGTFNAFTISDCSGVPYIRDTFSNGIKTWYPQNAINYYILILCDDSATRSVCTQQQVLPQGVVTTTTTTTKKTTTTTIFTTTTTEETETATYITEPQPSGKGFNFLWVLIIFIIIGVVFYFLRMRKRKKISYEELYQKWSHK